MRFPRKGIAIVLILMSNFPLNAQENGKEALVPVPKFSHDEPQKVLLGKALFTDPLFSHDNSLSCASCHSLKNAGVDGLIRYRGIDQKTGDYNTPTVLNARLNTRQFWDGRASDLNAVIEDHVKDKTIFNNTWPTIVHRVKDNATLHKQFSELYGEISEKTIKQALVVYLNTLLTPDSPFDRYLKGDKNALSADALKGYQLFQQYGCVTCHEGPNLGGNLYQRMGIYGNYLGQKSNLTKSDLGRFNITGKETDRGVFKVPGLRNVALTGPYLHNGEANTLEEVIALMGIYQVGQPIPSFDIPYLVKFLQSLNGEGVDHTTHETKPDSTLQHAPSTIEQKPL